MNLFQLTGKVSAAVEDGSKVILRFNYLDKDTTEKTRLPGKTAGGVGFGGPLTKASNIYDTRIGDHCVVHDSLRPQDIGHGHTNQHLAGSQQRGALWNEWKKEDEGYVTLESDTLTFPTVRALVVHSVDFFKPLTFNTNAKWAHVCVHRSATWRRKQQPAGHVC